MSPIASIEGGFRGYCDSCPTCGRPHGTRLYKGPGSMPTAQRNIRALLDRCEAKRRRERQRLRASGTCSHEWTGRTLTWANGDLLPSSTTCYKCGEYHPSKPPTPPPQGPPEPCEECWNIGRWSWVGPVVGWTTTWGVETCHGDCPLREMSEAMVGFLNGRPRDPEGRGAI